MVLLLLTVLLGLIVVWKLLRPLYFRRKKSLLLAHGVPSPKKHWLLGHLAEYPPTQDGILKSARRALQFPAMSMMWFGPTEAALECYHPDTVKPFLAHDLPKATFAYKFLRPWVGNSVLLASGDEWKRKRKTMDPAFSVSVLKSYVPVFNQCTEILLNMWEEQTSSTVELFEWVSLMSLDAFLRCCMSRSIDLKEEMKGKAQLVFRQTSLYVKAMHGLNDMVIKRIFCFHLWSDALFKRSELGKEFHEACRVVHHKSEEMISKKKEEALHRANNNMPASPGPAVFLDLIMNTTDDNGTRLTDSEIRHEVDTFMFAGHITTSSAIAWTLYNLAKHKEAQEKCVIELEEIRKDRDQAITWHQVQNIPYITMCVKESLRLYPPVTGVGRCPHQAVTIKHRFDDCPKTVPPGSTVNIRFFDLHRNPEIWSQPELYDPERFAPENAAKRPPYSFLPFSTGRRNCIGQNFAMLLIKVTVSRVLERYCLSLDPNEPEPVMKPEVVLLSENGIRIKISTRNPK